MIPFIGLAQDKEKDTTDTKKKDKLERAAFESSFIVDNATDVVLKKNSLEAQMGHRFGVIDFNENDFAGIWGFSNIRLGVAYGVHERVTLGFGTTKNDRLLDLNWKVAILRQTRSNKMPINMSYFGIAAYDTRKQWEGNSFQHNQPTNPFSSISPSPLPTNLLSPPPSSEVKPRLMITAITCTKWTG